MRKMDEMELNINLKAIKWSWLFTVIALFAWGTYTFIKTHIISPAIDIVIFQNVIYLYVMQISKWRMGDKDARNAFIWSLVGTVIALLVLGALIHYFPN